MFLFGHVGITLAAGLLARDMVIKKLVPEVGDRGTETFSPSLSHMSHKEDDYTNNRISSLALLRNRFDYRILLVGSLLPDLIDKPIGGVFFYSTFQNGRIFAHTLCFNILLAALGIYVLKRWRNTWLFILSFGSIIHLILDQMWLSPQTLLWPAYGWSFAKLDSTNFFGWLSQMFYTITTEPSVYVPEIIGLGLLVWFTARLIKEKEVYAFIRNGIA